MINELIIADGASFEPSKPEKKLLVLGDSISIGENVIRLSNRYCSRIAKTIGAQEFNKAIGGRHTDTQCGIFAMSRQLLRMNVKFTYIVNCHVDSEIFEKGLMSFARVTCAVKNFVGMRVGQVQVGLRPKPFCSVVFNEGHCTVARIDQNHGKYSIITGECDSTTGPYTFGTYMWAEFKDLDKWEIKYVPNIEFDLAD